MAVCSLTEAYDEVIQTLSSLLSFVNFNIYDNMIQTLSSLLSFVTVFLNVSPLRMSPSSAPIAGPEDSGIDDGKTVALGTAWLDGGGGGGAGTLGTGGGGAVAA